MNDYYTYSDYAYCSRKAAELTPQQKLTIAEAQYKAAQVEVSDCEDDLEEARLYQKQCAINVASRRAEVEKATTMAQNEARAKVMQAMYKAGFDYDSRIATCQFLLHGHVANTDQ